jgi:hypothetical protein
MSDDDAEDPFEQLDDAVGDREGNPFESLGERSDADDHPETGQSHNDGENHSGRDHQPEIPNREPLSSQSDDELTRGAGPSAPEKETDAAASTPEVSEMAGSESGETEMQFDVGRREGDNPSATEFSEMGQREGDPFDSFQDAFDEMDVDKLDPDVVWQELTSAESRGSVGDAQERTYAEVSKHSYCEGCEHFSEPPNVSCGHEGTEIVEFLDMETVRVVDCPVVTEREELESDDRFGQN